MASLRRHLRNAHLRGRQGARHGDRLDARLRFVGDDNAKLALRHQVPILCLCGSDWWRFAPSRQDCGYSAPGWPRSRAALRPRCYTRSGRAIRPWPGQGARFHDGRKYSRKKSGAPCILGSSPKTWRLQTSDEATRIRLGAQLKRWCLAWSGLIRAVFVIPHAGHRRCPAGNSRHADARRHLRRVPFPRSDLQSYRPDSTINQINRGELDILEAGAAVGRAIEIAGLNEHATDSYSS